MDGTPDLWSGAPREGLPLFSRPLDELQAPLLLMGSREDVMCRKDLEAEYQHILEILPRPGCAYSTMGRIRRWPPTAWQRLMRCGTFSSECLDKFSILR